MFCILIVIFVFGEMTMRMYGFCQSPLYYNNEYTGYNLVPNQNVKRFGNTYITNEYSMRSNPLNEREYRITLVGDSVLNGGVQTDQTELASTMLEENLQAKYGKAIRVLNISCGGWGIDNDANVFKEYGDFNSQMIVLVLNRHDAVGTIPKTAIAGNSKSFPTEQYSLAWQELFDRYLIPKLKSKLNLNGSKVNETNTSSGQEYSEGWEWFYEMCSASGIDLRIYLHATTSEIEAGTYNDNGEWIIDFSNDKGIPIYMDIKRGESKDYRDGIHFNEKGQEVICDILYPVIDGFIANNYTKQ